MDAIRYKKYCLSKLVMVKELIMKLMSSAKNCGSPAFLFNPALLDM